MNLFSLILATITLLIQEYADYDKEEDHNKTLLELKRDLNFPRIKSFDFIVVGGGTAGSLVAARLSEKFNVLLLESGGNPVPATESQFFSTAVQTDPTINNIFKSVPQFNFSQENGGIIETDTGKMLGGSGSHNDNVYNRGSPYDYDNFAKITGDNTWMYKNVLQHYKNFERLTGELIDEIQRTEFYGTRGPVTVETKMSPIMPAWIQSARELGYGVHDPNGNQTEGFTPLVMSMINGKRVSAYSAFIKPIQNSRPTLTVLTYSEVEQVLINSDKRAYGVLYRRHGIIQVAHASKEVIVCAGTISSPLLLMRSGIGSKEVLEKAKIPVLSDLKGVGRNFQNHGSVVLHYKVNNPNKTLLLTVDENDMETEVMKYLDSKPSGILTETNYAQAFIASSRAKSNGEGHWPDLQVGFGQQPAIVKGALQAISSNIKVGRMKSSGVVELNTTAYLNGFRDDLHLALIDHRAFSDSSDVDVLIEGIQLSLKIMETTTPFRKMGVQLTDTSPQKCGSLVFRSRDYWKCYIQQRGQVVLHLTGTCSMGPKTDPMAVVDSKLRVYGIWRLRVVDGSVMPRTPNSNTNAPVMLVAEKASQDILATYASK